MADVVINKFTTQILRDGATPSSPGFVVSEGQDPVNPPGTNNFVPYSGAISNVELGEYGLESGFITLDTTPTGTPTDQGTIYWDDSKSTAALIMNGTTQHIGQDTYFYVKNSTGSNIAKGTAVRFDGTDGASGHLKIAPFLADGTYPSAYFMGVTAEAIDNGEFGQVTNFGEIEGIDTSIYSAGDLLYASTTSAGGFQTTAPVAPNNIVLIAAAVNSKNNGAIIVRPTYGSNINDDEGVKIVSPTTGDLLQLQAGGLWENKTKAQILGGTSSQFVKGDGSLDSTSYQPLLTNPVTGTGTTNYLPKFTGASTIGNSRIFDNGTNVGINTITPNDFIDGESGMSILQSTNGRAVLSLVGTRTDAGEALGRISFTNSLSTNAGGKRLAYISGVRGTTNNSAYLEFAVANDGLGTAKMILSQTGNLGLGVTPSAWNTNSRALQLSQFVSLSHQNNASLNLMSFALETSANAFTYADTGVFPLRYNQNPNNGVHSWYNAGTGTAGNPISFTQAMTLFSTGNLGIGVGGTDAGFKLDVNGTGRFSSSLNLGGYLTGQGNNPGGLGGSRYVLDWLSGQMRLFSYGANSSTNGGFLFNSQRSDGTNSINYLDIASTGAATFSSNQNATTVYTFENSNTANTNSRSYINLVSGTSYLTLKSIHGDHSYIDSSSNLYFQSANSVKMLITSSGNVGIGTSTVFSPLHLNANGNYSTSGNMTTGFVISNSTTGRALNLGTFDSGGYSWIQAAYVNNADTTFPLALQPRGGNVGIGTSSPSNKLDVLGSAASPNLVGTNAYARFYQSGGFANVTIGALASGSFAGWIQTSDGVGTQIPLSLQPSGGNVLIGTTTDVGVKLHVNGAIRTEPIGPSSITGNWKFGNVVAGTITENTSLLVEIDGVEYRINAREV